MSERQAHEDGLLHVFECAHWLEALERRCGFLSGEPGFCPYDHTPGGPRSVELIEITATVRCFDCSCPIERDDCRGDDGRLLCSQCVMSEIR